MSEKIVHVKWIAVGLVLAGVLFSWGFAYATLRAADAALIEADKAQREDVVDLKACLQKLTEITDRHEKHVILYEHKINGGGDER